MAMLNVLHNDYKMIVKILKVGKKIISVLGFLYNLLTLVKDSGIVWFIVVLMKAKIMAFLSEDLNLNLIAGPSLRFARS